MSKKLKQLLSILLSTFIMAGVALPASAVSVNNFTDVSAGAWYYHAVEYAVAEGLFAGTAADTFSPNMGMTRGMFVTVLGRKIGVDKTAHPTSRFTDVKPGDWFGPYVEWAAENGIVHGIGDGKFDPNRKISREQMAKILYEFAKLGGGDFSDEKTGLDAFPDSDSVSLYAYEAMKWAVSHGILKGTDGKLDPQGTTTRAQVAQVFFNAKDILKGVGNPIVPSDSAALEEIKGMLEDMLPDSCQWSEDAVKGGWRGPIKITDGGRWNGVSYTGAAYVAKFCEYLLTEIDGFVYPYYYIKETPEGFFCYYA